jgi:hypothetical protein
LLILHQVPRFAVNITNHPLLHNLV